MGGERKREEGYLAWRGVAIVDERSSVRMIKVDVTEKKRRSWC